MPKYIGVKKALYGQSGAWVLNAGGGPATLDIDFVNDRAWNNGLTTIPSLLTCTRASTGYYTKADGTLVSFGNNTLRYGTNGLLVEEARTNELVRSQEFDNVNWLKTRSSVSANSTTAPDGTSTADTFVENDEINFHSMTGSFTAAAATAYTFSVYAKPAGRTWMLMQYSTTAGFTSDRYAYFDVGNGVVGTTQADTTAGIEALAGGWYRCWITSTSDADGGASTAQFVTATDGSTIFYDGDNASGLYLWNAQVEAGAFPTSPILTVGTSMTRAADDVVMTPVPFFSDTAGTLYLESKIDAPSTTTNYVANLINAAGTKSVSIWNSLGTGQASINDNGLVTADTFVAGVFNKKAIAYAENDGAGVGNGGAPSTDNTITLNLSTVDRLKFGLATVYVNGNVKRFAYWNTRLSNTTLQTLTT